MERKSSFEIIGESMILAQEGQRQMVHSVIKSIGKAFKSFSRR